MKVFRILGRIFLVLILLLAGAVAFFFIRFPRTSAPPDVTVEKNGQRIKQGEYLVKNVVACLACHSQRNKDYYSEPIVSGTEGQGDLFLKVEGLGTLYSPNITPHGIADWSDGELIRAIISGVNKDGKALFPIMPYQSYAHLSQEDLYSIVAYIRTLRTIRHDVPRSNLDFPLNMIVRTIPKPTPINTAAETNRGKYLATVALCHECHTPTDRGEPLPGMDFAGGAEFGTVEIGIVRSVNITPDPDTGIGKWNREYFIQTFKRFANPDAQQITIEKGTPNTVMPWTIFSGMTEEDLGAIYDYLKTVKPVKNKVEKFVAPTKLVHKQ